MTECSVNALAFLFKMLESRLSFLSNGVTTAVLNTFGTVPELSDMFIISVITGTKTSICSCTKLVGRGSRIHVLGEECKIKSLIYFSVTGLNSEKSTPS